MFVWSISLISPQLLIIVSCMYFILSFGEDKIKYMQETIISHWGDINEIDHTNIILNGMYINYSVLCQFSLPNLFPVPLASNIIRMPKLSHFLMIGQRWNLCQRHILRTRFKRRNGYRTRENLVPILPFDFQLKLTSLTIISWSLKSTCSSEDHARYEEIMIRYCCSIFLCCKTL